MTTTYALRLTLDHSVDVPGSSVHMCAEICLLI